MWSKVGDMFCSKYMSFGLGMFAGVFGFYMMHKISEHQELMKVQEEINALMNKLNQKTLTPPEQPST